MLTRTWTGDPFTNILAGGNLELAPHQLGANVRAALIGGQVHVITLGPKPEDIVGVALWYAPGSSAFSRRVVYTECTCRLLTGSKNYISEEERAAGWNQFLEIAPDDLRKWWTDYVPSDLFLPRGFCTAAYSRCRQFIPTMTRLSADTLGSGYTHNAWHLHIFGVMKVHHRKGYGKALFRLAENQVRIAG